MTNILLYATTVLIWGTTWIAIRLQVGEVAISASLFYRFVIASTVLMLILKLTGHLQKITARQHLSCLLLSLFLFSVNYLFFYNANHYIVSGLISVIFSMVTVVNMANSYLFYHQKPNPRLIAGALLGVSGITLLFWPYLSEETKAIDTLIGMSLTAAGTLCFSLGSMLSAHQQKQGLSVVTVNAWGMMYGAIILGLITLASGTPFTFSTDTSYIASLLYLAVPGSVVAFNCYLMLVGRIGAQKAAYSTVLFPLIALSISTVFEGYSWSLFTLCGVDFGGGSNVMVFYPSRVQKST